MNLASLIETHLDLPRLSKDLGELGHAARTWSVRRWSRGDMARLWEAAEGFRAITLEDFVPASAPPLVEIVHAGKNSLPAHTIFEKHICRPTTQHAGGTLVGYNRHSLSGITGPGYFVVRPSDEPGEILFDYTMPAHERPEGWPDIAPSDAGFSRFVYGGTIDLMRGLADHVTMGRATDRGRPLDRWFVLVREDPKPEPS